MWELANISYKARVLNLNKNVGASNKEWEWMGEALSGKDHAPMILQEYPAASWYALTTRSRQEKLVRDGLADRGIEQLLPLTRRLSQWSDRKKWIEVPLFSGFCFGRFSLENQLSVLTVPGVVRIVGCKGPEAIPDEEMLSLQKLAVSGLDYERHEYCEEGMIVEVIGGPLAGVRGTLIRKAGRDHVVVRVRLIQQSASVQVVRSNIRPVRNANDLPLACKVRNSRNPTNAYSS
jgi:transcription termination/antitermination protein NusG